MAIKFKVTRINPQDRDVDLLVWPLVTDRAAIKKFIMKFKGLQDLDKVVTLKNLQTNRSGIEFTPMRQGMAKRVLVIGMDKTKIGDLESLVNVFAHGAKATKGAGKVALVLPEEWDQKQAIRAAVYGFSLASYRFVDYKSKKDRDRPVNVTLFAKAMRGQLAGFKEWTRAQQVVVESIFMARDLVQSPPTVMNPDAMVRQAEKIAWAEGMDLKVFREKELLDMGAKLLLAVGAGSHWDPALVHLAYKPAGAKKKVALVGKGITYDAGGYHLKPRGYLEDMKGDMAGAAAVFGAVQAAARLKLPVEVHGIAAITDNIISAKSMKPGDVFTAMNGKTVEVWDTDAEGRLVLADALTYADGLKTDYIIDLATLTGSCVVALGEDAAGLFTADPGMARRMETAAEATAEPVWRLPMYEKVRAKLDSDIADIKNIGGRWAGATQGAMFLKEFVKNKKWVHLDIAGPALRDNPTLLSPKGGSGFGVALLVEFLRGLAG